MPTLRTEEFELEPGEVIVHRLRKHWLVFVIELLPFLLFSIVPLIGLPVIAYFASVNPQLPASFVENLSLGNPWIRLFFGCWWLLMWTGAFNTFTRYYLDVWIITTHRIINVEQVGFFNRRVSSFLIERVQDVTTDVEGILSTFFDIGSLRVETAGEASRQFRIDGIPNPEEHRDLIMREVSLLHSEGKGLEE